MKQKFNEWNIGSAHGTATNKNDGTLTRRWKQWRKQTCNHTKKWMKQPHTVKQTNKTTDKARDKKQSCNQ